MQLIISITICVFWMFFTLQGDAEKALDTDANDVEGVMDKDNNLGFAEEKTKIK